MSAVSRSIEPRKMSAVKFFQKDSGIGYKRTGHVYAKKEKRVRGEVLLLWNALQVYNIFLYMILHIKCKCSWRLLLFGQGSSLVHLKWIVFISCSIFKVSVFNGLYDALLFKFFKRWANINIIYTVRYTNFELWAWNRYYQFQLKLRGSFSLLFCVATN